MAVVLPDQANESAKHYLEGLLTPAHVLESYPDIVNYYHAQVKSALSPEDSEIYTAQRAEEQVRRRLGGHGSAILTLVKKFCLERGLFPNGDDDLFRLLMPVMLREETVRIKSGLQKILGNETKLSVHYGDRQLGLVRTDDGIHFVTRSSSTDLPKAYLMTAPRIDPTFGVVLVNESYSEKGVSTDRIKTRFAHAAEIWRAEDFLYQNI